MRKIIKINTSGEPPEVFHSLKTFFAKYPQYEKHKENDYFRIKKNNSGRARRFHF